MLKPKLIVGVFKHKDIASNKVKTVGYRFYDIQRHEIEDFEVKDKKFLSYLIKNRDNIENGTWDAGRTRGVPKIKFLNGVEQRYPVLDASTGKIVGLNPLVIAAEFKDGYLVVGPYGDAYEWTKEQALAYAKLNGIANGSVKKMGNTEFISSITGKYSYIDRKINTPEEAAKKAAIDKAKKVKKEALKQEDNLKETKDKEVLEKDATPVKETEAPFDMEKELELAEKIIEEINEKNKAKLIEHNDDPIAQSILDNEEGYPDITLNEEELNDALSSIPSTDNEKVQKYDDDFYKLLEPTFGGEKSVAILKYMIEERNYGIDAIYELIREGKEVNKYVPTLIGLITRYVDSLYKKRDKELEKLCKEAIAPDVIKIVDDLTKKGIEFSNVWDANIVVQKRNHDTSKWAFPLSLIEERIANYIADSGEELYNCIIEKDGTTYYNGIKVDVPGYRISGVNPKYITITSELGKSKKVMRK